MSWISVKDQMPEPWQTVAVHYDDIDYSGNRVGCGYLKESGRWTTWDTHDGANVTHWQPLPEPMKPESEADEGNEWSVRCPECGKMVHRLGPWQDMCPCGAMLPESEAAR